MAKAKKYKSRNFNTNPQLHCQTHIDRTSNLAQASNKEANIKVKNQPRKQRKQRIPLAVRQAVWQSQFGEIFKHKCYVSWCHRVISCFDFEVGHNVPESKGGTLNLDNLLPICHQCNIGMGNQYTITDWSNKKFKID